MKNKLTIVIIARNEEKQIPVCLASAAFADEIILVDSGSTDNTVETARKSGAEVYEVEFTDFSQLRNLGKEKAANGWIFYLDADEEIPPDLKNEIMETVKTDKDCCYTLERKNYYLGKLWPVPDTVTRLFKKELLKTWSGQVHESPLVTGALSALKFPLIHRTHNNLEEMLENTVSWSEFEAKARFNANHPAVTWWRIFRMMLTAFTDSYFKQKGYKVGTAGLIESTYQAFSSFVTYAKLWEMQNN